MTSTSVTFSVAASTSTLNIASLGRIVFGSSDVTITHNSYMLSVTGGTSYRFDAPAFPTKRWLRTGSSTFAWSDLYLATGGLVNFGAGDVTITHAASTLTFDGASSGYRFSSCGRAQIERRRSARRRAWRGLNSQSGDRRAGQFRQRHNVDHADWRVIGCGCGELNVVGSVDATEFQVSNTKVGAQGAAVTDALTGGSATAANCATTINLVIDRLQAHGLIL